ncbi:MAG: efflux RND transporter periplasmic adaptor subunit [Halioglobus sp.]
MTISRLVLSSIALLVASNASAQISSDLTYDCLIEASVSVELGSAVRGVAEEIRVKRGDAVTEGDVLVELDSRVRQAAVALAKARSENTAELASREESMKLARKLLVRFQGLYENNNVSQQQLEESESQATIAESNWHQAQENQVLAELELLEAQEMLAMRTITSPITGLVVERMIAPGELVNEDEPIMRLATLDPLHVEVILPASEIGKVSLGSIATVFPAAPIGGEYAGRVTIVDSVIDAGSGTFGVRIELPNPDQKLPAGLGCSVDFLAAQLTEPTPDELN